MSSFSYSSSFSTDTSGCYPLSSSSCHGISCTAPASSICPRRASGLLGAVRCDPQPLPELQYLASGTPHRVDGAPGTSCSLFSNGCCILLLLPTGFLPGASSCVSHSTAVLALPVPHSRGACREPLVCMASAFHTPPDLQKKSTCRSSRCSPK
jgi:hypothetical protein